MVALVPLVPAAGKAALTLLGGSASKMAVRSFTSGAAFQAGAELVAQIAEWARAIDGEWDSESAGPTPPGGDDCWEVTTAGICWIENRNSPGTKVLGWEPENVKRIIQVVPSLFGDTPPQSPSSTATLELEDGRIVEANSGIWPYEEARWYLQPLPGGECSGNSPSDPLPPQQLPRMEVDGCQIDVTFFGYLGNEDGSGNIEPVFKFSPATDARASGGVIVGECNFAPTVVIGGGGDGGKPPTPYPDPPDDDGSDPWWEAIVRGVATGATQAIVNQILTKLLTTQAEASYTLVAPCDYDEEGNKLERTWEFPRQDAQQRILQHQVAILQVLQQHLDWRTPICSDDTSSGEGDFRTISFRSDETSPFGKSRLRKRFRYLSVSGNDLAAVVNHWKAFSFEGGPYRVRWIGRSWRSPEIWAATESEGQRVIQHAAAEAGFSPLENGRWSTRLTSSSRCGVPGTMRIDTTKGFYWITARDGSDARPIVASKLPEFYSGVEATRD